MAARPGADNESAEKDRHGGQDEHGKPGRVLHLQKDVEPSCVGLAAKNRPDATRRGNLSGGSLSRACGLPLQRQESESAESAVPVLPYLSRQIFDRDVHHATVLRRAVVANPGHATVRVHQHERLSRLARPHCPLQHIVGPATLWSRRSRPGHLQARSPVPGRRPRDLSRRIVGASSSGASAAATTYRLRLFIRSKSYVAPLPPPGHQATRHSGRPTQHRRLPRERRVQLRSSPIAMPRSPATVYSR